MTDTDKILDKKLRQIFDNDDFVLGTFCYLSSQLARKELIKYIDNHKNVTSDEVCLISLEYAE